MRTLLLKSVLIAFLTMTGVTNAEPFALLGSDEIRNDAIVSWSNFSMDHGTTVPTSTVFARSDGGTGVTLAGSNSLSIHNSGGLSTQGVHLANDAGPFEISLGGDSVQGVAFTIEHRQAVRATYTIQIFDTNNIPLGRLKLPADTATENASFVGLIDPEANIGSLVIDSIPSNQVVITDLTIQEKQGPSPLDSLPVSSTATLEVSADETYLHQGVSFHTIKSPATFTATVDNENAHDLLDIFPSLQPGDIIRFESQGLVSDRFGENNAMLAVLSSEETLLEGSEILRLPSAIKVVSSVYTPPVSNGRIKTPTDISADFLVGSSRFITVPIQARYLMLTLQRPGQSPAAPALRLSHIPRQPFDEWAASLGLVGTLADPNHDLDGDGLSLLEEFAYSKDPTEDDASRPADFAFEPFLAETSPRLRFNVGLRRDAPIRYLPEYSSDLVHWETLPEDSMKIIFSAGNRAIFTTSDPTGGPRRFGRIRFVYTPTSN